MYLLNTHVSDRHPLQFTLNSPTCFDASQSAAPACLYSEEEPIPHNDGNDTINDDRATPSEAFPSIQERCFVFENRNNDVPQLTSCPAKSTSYVTHAGYTLNKMKQVSTLAKHASLNDFSIETTSDHNTNIQCNTGFYEAVSKPALTSIHEGFEMIVNGSLVKCLESRIKKDQLGRYDNHVLRFNVKGHGSSVLHLHHTQQLVQVQGSGSLWFVDDVLKHLFTSEAKKKHLIISDLNKIFDATRTNTGRDAVKEAKACDHCKVKFKSNAKPSICGNCTKYFHNTKQNKCFLFHNCAGTATHGSTSVLSWARTGLLTSS